jgi:hypothetical protein
MHDSKDARTPYKITATGDPQFQGFQRRLIAAIVRFLVRNDSYRQEFLEFAIALMLRTQSTRKLEAIISFLCRSGIRTDTDYFLEKAILIIKRADKPRKLRSITIQIKEQFTINELAVIELLAQPETLHFYLQFRQNPPVPIMAVIYAILEAYP